MKIQIDSVIQLCEEVGQFQIQNLHESIAELKGDDDLVTNTDKESERLLRESLLKLLPGSVVLGEEFGLSDVRSKDRVWIIDPLDGTVNFASQLPFFSISVALLEKGIPVLGVIHAPALQETYSATLHGGAFLNQRKILSKLSGKALEMIATSAGMTSSDFKDRNTSYHAKLLPHFSRLRLIGSQALHVAFVASGRLYAALTNQAKLWDDAAGALILQEAGGVYCDFNGEPIFPLKEDSPFYLGEGYCSLAVNSVEAKTKIVSLLKG